MKEMVGGCCVCSDERGWPENPLVYCDGQNCTVAVHQACYGIVTVPTGPWYCRKCESQERPARVRCELCPSRDGALKRTDNQGWAHVVCALYIPEVRFGNVTTMEPIILQLIPSERYAKTCYICQEIGKPNRANVGACMQCNKFNCKQQFHVTCAQSLGLLCEEAGNYLDNVKYCGYCQHHYSKLKKGGNVKTIPPYKPITHDSSGSDSGSSPEKEIDSTINATASSTSATSIKITNAIGSVPASSSGSIGLSSTKQRKSSIGSKQLTLSSSNTTATTVSNPSGSNTATPANCGTSSSAGPSSSNDFVSVSGGTNTNNAKSNNNSGSSKDKEKHSKNIHKINSSKDKDKELSTSSLSSTSSREKGSKYKNKDVTEHGSNGSVVPSLGGSAVQNVTNLGSRSGSGMDILLNASDNIIPVGETISNPPIATMPMKNSGISLAKKRKADSKTGIFTDTNDINHSFRDIIKDVSVTLTPLPLDKSSDLGEVEKATKKQRTELSPPTHQSTESSISNVSPRHSQTTKNHSHSVSSASQAQNVTSIESTITSSTTPSPPSGPAKPTKEREERVRSSSPFTSTTSNVAGTGITTGNSVAPSLYVSVPLSTANVPGLNLPTTTTTTTTTTPTTDHATPSQSTRAATQQQPTIIERQSPRINQQITSSPVASENVNFSSSHSSPVNTAMVQSGKSTSPNITGGSLTASTTESGNLKISYDKQSSRVAQIQEQESAPVRRSRSRSGEHNNLMPTKARFGKKRSTNSTNSQLAKSSSSSSLAVGSSEHKPQTQHQQKLIPTGSQISNTPDNLTENVQKSLPTSPVSVAAAPPPPPPPPPTISSFEIVDSNISEVNSSNLNNTISNNFSKYTKNNTNKSSKKDNCNNNAINLTSSSPSTPTTSPPPVSSTPSPIATPSFLPSAASTVKFNSNASNTTQSTSSSSKSNNSSSEGVNNTMPSLNNSCTNRCSPITPPPPPSAPLTPTPLVVTSSAGSSVPASKTLNKKLLRAQQSHFLQQQQQIAAIQQQQQQQQHAVTKTIDETSSTSSPSSLQLIDDSNTNIPPPPTISRTPDSGIFSSSLNNVSGNSQSSISTAPIPSSNGGLKFSYEPQSAAVPTTAIPANIDTILANNSAFKDSPPSSPASETGSARKRGRKTNEMKDVKVFHNGCAVSTPVTTPIPVSTTNVPMHATHMLGNQLNPASSVAQKLTDQLHMEMQDHSVYIESQPPQFVGVPFPSKPVNNVRNPTITPSSANSLASMFGGGGGGYAPQSLEQLLERQWEQGSQFLMEQAQHFDIASLLSCLHQLQTENVRLEEHVNNLIARRDHLLAVNARLAIPLNANVPQSQVNPNNIHQNGPTQTEVAVSTVGATTISSTPLTSSVNTTSSTQNSTTLSRNQRLNVVPTSAVENGTDFRQSSAQQSVSVTGGSTTVSAPVLTQSSTNISSRLSSSAPTNFSTASTSSSVSHSSNHQHQSHQHQQQQLPSLAQQSTMPSSVSNVSLLTSTNRQNQQQSQAQSHHPHQQSHHLSHQTHHAQQHAHNQLQHQALQQQHQQHQQSLHSQHQHTQHQSHQLVQHSHNHLHPSSTASSTATPHHIQLQHHQMTMTSSASGLSGSSGSSRTINNGSGIAVNQTLSGRPVHSENSGYHPVYSHQSQLRRDESQGKAS